MNCQLYRNIVFKHFNDFFFGKFWVTKRKMWFLHKIHHHPKIMQQTKSSNIQLFSFDFHRYFRKRIKKTLKTMILKQIQKQIVFENWKTKRKPKIIQRIFYFHSQLLNTKKIVEDCWSFSLVFVRFFFLFQLARENFGITKCFVWSHSKHFDRFRIEMIWESFDQIFTQTEREGER